MQRIKHLLTLLLLLSVTTAWAQKRELNLEIHVTAATGESLEGQAVTCTQTDYAVNYETVYLDAEGTATLKIYAGNHRVSVSRAGFGEATQTFNATADTRIDLTLVEDTRKPFALTTEVAHDPFTGLNNVTLSWNKEAPAFFDDFESYEPFSISFGDWTGIDADGIAAAPLAGDYQNRGAFMYAQIMNPMTVEPAWWYDYEVLRPYSGKQYVGFVCTTSGAANDDWLISPTITPGTDNVLSFMAKAGDVGKERFQVYVTEQTENPTENDFTQINAGNYESVSYETWEEFRYDLSAYAGKPIKFALRYISARNTESTFMLMVDDVYVGQAPAAQSAASAARTLRVGNLSPRSADNPNERFRLYLNGELQGETEEYSHTFTNLAAGDYTFGVQAVYKASETEVSTLGLTLAATGFAQYTIRVTANNGQSLEGCELTLVSRTDGTTFTAPVTEGAVAFRSLPLGTYLLGIEAKGFDALEREIVVEADGSTDVELKETIVNPYNVTAAVTPAADDRYTVELKWNRSLAFSDGFEDYADFAQGSFGDWLSLDMDRKAVYPIALGSQTNIVTFPGASTPDAPQAVAPLVFNAWTTEPAMSIDPAALPLNGQKQVVFFSPQSAQADKWLISPRLDVREGYVLRVAAKSYSEMYPESLTFCVSTTDTAPESFVPLTQAAQMAGEWREYETDLAAYAGQQVYIGVHYVTYDGMFAQLDDFYVGTPDGEGVTVDVGAVKNYEVYLDGALQATPEEAACTLTDVAEGAHTAGIKAVYASGVSELTTYAFSAVPTAIDRVTADKAAAAAEYFTPDGRRVSRSARLSGVYLRKVGDRVEKVLLR